MNVENLTRAALRAAIDKADAESSALCDALIIAGRGHERPSETRAKTDDLSMRYIAAADRCAALYGERSRRVAYHGTEHRIRRDTQGAQ